MRDVADRPAASSAAFAHPAWRGTAGGHCVWIAPCWQALTGQSTDAAREHGWRERIHPDDCAALAAMWDCAQHDGHGIVDLRILRARAGGHRWLRIQVMRVDPADEAHWIAGAVDIDDLRGALDGERLRRQGLQHRVRNTLSVIRSIGRRTAETSDSVEAYRARFDGRLAAFARAQGHILRAGPRGIDLEALLVDELLANQACFRNRIRYGGPEVRLPPRLTDQLGLALHELTANAVQFGALAHDGGRLSVGWSVQGHPAEARLHLDWQEEVPDGGIVAPESEGFGLELLTRSLQYEIDATVTLDFQTDGLRCKLIVPLPAPPLA